MNNSSYIQPGVNQQTPAGSPLQPSAQIDSRKQKRHYPRFQNSEASQPGYQQSFQQPPSPYQQPHSPYQQPHSPYQQPRSPYQQPHSPFQQPQTQPQQHQPQHFQQTPQPTSSYGSPVPSQTGYTGNYNQALDGMANMHMNTAPKRQDVSLVGQPALIQDFQLKTSSPPIPLEVGFFKISKNDLI